MKRIIIFIGILSLVGGCTYSPSPETVKEEIKTVQPKVITFDENEGKGSTAKNFYFLFDGSGSMDQYCSGKRKIDGAKLAVNKFLNQIPEDVNLGLLVFGTSGQNECTEVVPLGSNNREKFKGAINNVDAWGGTPLAEAIRIGTKKLVEQYKKQLGYGEYRLVVVTDGNADSYHSMVQECKNIAQYPFIALYSIGLCLDSEHALKSYALSYRDANNYKDLEKALIEVMGEIDVFDASVFDESLFEGDTLQ